MFVRELACNAYRLAVNKSPAVSTLSPALDGLWRENRGSVNRLYENENNHFHFKGFALTLACSSHRDSLVRGDWESGCGRVFPTVWEPGTGYTHPRFKREDSGHSEMAKFLKGKKSTQKKAKRRFTIYAGAQVPLRPSELIKWRTQTEERFSWKAVHLSCVTAEKT